MSLGGGGGGPPCASEPLRGGGSVSPCDGDNPRGGLGPLLVTWLDADPPLVFVAGGAGHDM